MAKILFGKAKDSLKILYFAKNGLWRLDIKMNYSMHFVVLCSNY